MADASLLTLDSSLKQHDSKVSSGGTVRAYSHNTGSGPVLCLVHGYPQSAYMWRHVVPLLKEKHTLYIPELPGYGISSLPPKSDKRTVGNLIMEGLRSVFGDRKVIWTGHDRGGRVGHRIVVDNKAEHNIIAAMFLDIVPTTEQWKAFANPAASVAYFHWPLLASPAAVQVITQIGGYNWTKGNLERIKGSNSKGASSFQENDAIEHYSKLFDKAETIKGSCADYAAGAFEDVDEQKKDQKEGKKVELPLMAVYSASNLGRMHDVDAVWPEWVSGKSELRCVGIPDGYGHYLPEECPEKVAELIEEWVSKYGTSQ
ncbi:hypothetical protein LTR56_007120 [Elasticomyces elasticus]|nr:hypothetical protein LTR22_020459 [Elasticomyces elasticus]KAK3648988.1 hypothetical protein LTR56_007120 [Elasticomyces elasticus]KAK4917812.1 hypothetical protein LTR49_014349 [Elasticomyces elasticus]KAK4954866.1 hypothetical protein LTR10_007058 [Elasticomyces elasticus]KAK4978876.1 hypothetical protein LTR42_001376 [Elasticomyces elasticus]